MQRLARVPPVIAALGDDVHFLVLVLPDVACVQLAGAPIERHAPDVAEAVRPDLRARAVDADERIVLRDAVGAIALGTIDVDAQDLREQRAQVLPRKLRVVGCAAVAAAQVEHAVGAEEDGAAVVVRVRIVDGEEHLLAVGLRGPGLLVHGPAREHVVALALLVTHGVVDEERRVLREVRVERERQKPFLVAGAVDLLADVHEDRCFLGIARGGIEDQDAARLLHHVHALVVARFEDHLDGSAEHHFRGDALELELGHGHALRRGRGIRGRLRRRGGLRMRGGERERHGEQRGECVEAVLLHGVPGARGSDEGPNTSPVGRPRPLPPAVAPTGRRCPRPCC